MGERVERDRSQLDRSSLSAFAPGFLRRILCRDESISAAEAELAGPWKVVPAAGGWAVLRWEESLEDGDPPAAIFRERERALLAAAVLPGTGRVGEVRLCPEEGPQGFPLECQGKVVGHLRPFDDELASALQVVDALVRAPRSLATVLQAAGPEALRRIGRILHREGLGASDDEGSRGAEVNR